MEPNDKAALAAAVAATIHGETDAYTVIVTACMQKLYYTALSLCRNAATAEDMVQETLIDGYLHLSELREPEKVESWLQRMLRNKTLNYITRAPAAESDAVLYTLDSGESPEVVYLSRESMQEWKMRINILSPALRQTAVLYFLHEMTMEEIAHRTRTPLGTVKRRIHDARKQLKKEYIMEQSKTILPDTFAAAVAEKIKELETYTKTYGTVGFDDAYKNVKALIGELSDTAQKREYSVRSAKIAAAADNSRYGEEALSIYRQYDDVVGASWLYLDLCWKLDDGNAKFAYTRDTILPALEAYPDSLLKNYQLAYHNFWMAHYTDKSTPAGIAEARAYLSLAEQQFGDHLRVDATYGNILAAQKGLDCMEDGYVSGQLTVTGETWQVCGDNLYYYNQPGCNYITSSLYRYDTPIFYHAGFTGDRYFFPQDSKAASESFETMVNQDGQTVGARAVISADETVETPAGVFAQCLHIRKTDNDGDTVDAWYKEGVGLVRLETNRAAETKVLSAYEIRGGTGYLPLAVGNRWCYETPDRPDVLYERNEYIIEQMGQFWDETVTDTTVSLSCLNYTALQPGWETVTDDPQLQFAAVDGLCDEKKYPAAYEKLSEMVRANRTRESVDIALSAMEYLREKLEQDALGWRYCPSSINVTHLRCRDGKILYGEAEELGLNTGAWGTRGEENRIFGVKPFRYLQILCGTLWDKKWVPGYTEERAHGYKSGTIHLAVTDGGSIETPAGTFDKTIRLRVTFETEGNRDDYGYYFYNNTECGTKEFWFAPGIGVVRFVCDWNGHLTSEAVLTAYQTVAAENEMFPIYLGNRWRYEEVNLTRENYIARRDCRVLCGRNGDYLLGDHQMFTFRGDTAAYDAFKASLAEKKEN